MTQTMIRPLTHADRQQARDLWASRFTDSPSFIDWFFRARYLPESSICAVQDGRIVSMALGTPMTLSTQNGTLDAMMLSGVSTRIGYEKRGLMFAVLSRMLRLCADERVAVAFNTPVRLGAYDALGFAPISQKRLFTQRNDTLLTVRFDAFPAIEELVAVYTRATQRYAACVVRTQREMQCKLDDYRSDGAKCIAAYREGALIGYIIAFETENGLCGEECLALDTEAYQALLERLPAGATAKLPPDCPFDGVISEQAVARCVDVPAVLQTLPDGQRRTYRVKDPILPENNRAFGRIGASDAKDDAIETLSVGALAQLAFGYGAGNGKKPCFMVDEY